MALSFAALVVSPHLVSQAQTSNVPSEATEAGGEPHFGTLEAEPVESKKELRFAFAFELPTQSELLPEFHTGVVSEMEELAV